MAKSRACFALIVGSTAKRHEPSLSRLARRSKMAIALQALKRALSAPTITHGCHEQPIDEAILSAVSLL